MLASHDENPIEDDELLTGTGSGGVFTSGYLRERPLIEYLDGAERVAYLLSNSKKGIREESDGGGTAYTPGDGYQAIAAVTDTRIMFVVGDCAETDGDAMFAVPYTEIENVKTDGGVLTKHLDIWTTAGTRWRFYVKSSVDLQPAADYVDLAAVVWTRVENQLVNAKEHTTRITDLVDDRAFETAVDAASQARAHVDEARRMATELTENRSDAVWERILAVEKRLNAARLDIHRAWGTSHEHGAERQWRQELYNKAYESYEAAREEYETALDIARDQGLPAVDDLIDEIDDVRHDLDHLSKSPLRRAEETRDRAAEIDDPAVAAETWEDALERYQTSLVLGWGSDDDRFAGDSAEIKGEIERIVDRIDETRRGLADRHESIGEEHFENSEYERARREYAHARDHLSRAVSIAEELRPDLVEGLRTRMDDLEDRIAAAEQNAAANPFEFVGDTGRNSRSAAIGDRTREMDTGSDDLRDRLVAAGRDAFVDTVAAAWTSMGWTTTVVESERDARVDVIAEKSHPVPETQLLVTEQAPVTGRLDADVIANVAPAIEADYDVDVIAFVTTGVYTDGAHDVAAEHSVKLIDGEGLVEILRAEGIEDVDSPDQRSAAD